jgi:glycosyltransferase involved in cell wall biosynthesis
MEIHQVIVSASPGDAVTNAALGTRELLRRIGPSEIFARYVHPRLAGDVLLLGEYPGRATAARGQNLLVYHASIGEPEVLSFLLQRPERLVLVYHNITPAEYFAVLDPAFAELLAVGRAELGMLRDRVDLALAVSAYNARELEALGYRDVRLSPLVVDVESLRSLQPNPQTVAHLEEHLHGPLVLFVGQLLPHKRPDLLLEAYHVLVTYLVPDAYLAMVGPSRQQDGYRDVLEAFRLELNLQSAWIPGRVAPDELVAFFRAASVFVTLSEHEGVCVPLLEAMAFGLPVAARDFAAIPDTLGGAGLLLPPEDDPLLIAEALARLIEDEDLRARLVALGTERLADFEPEKARATFLAHLAEVA